jgi:hypothetical protein
LHTPLEEFVAFAVTFKFETEVEAEGISGAGAIDLDGVVDDEVDGYQRFDDSAVFSQASDGFAHGGEVDEQGDAGEVLKDDAGDDERDFSVDRFGGVPGSEGANVLFGDGDAVAITEDGFEDKTDGDGEAGDFANAGFLEGGEGIDVARFAACFQGAPDVEGIKGGGHGKGEKGRD